MDMEFLRFATIGEGIQPDETIGPKSAPAKFAPVHVKSFDESARAPPPMDQDA